MTGAAPLGAAPLAAAPPAAAAPPRRRAVRGWLAIGVAVVVIGVAAAWIAGLLRTPVSGLLDAESTAPDGGRALAEILRDHGVAVEVVRDARAAEDAVGPDATLLLGDASPLTDEAVTDLAAAAGDVVLVQPRSRDLRLLLGASPGGVGDGIAAPECALDEALRAGPIEPGAVFAPGDTAQACYPSGEGYGLVVREDGDRRTSALDAAVLLTNARLAEDGNAALGINLLGREPIVVWYLPTATASEATLGDLTPAWVTPALVLLAAAAVTAGVWRGRRFGPLVVETLPVTVRAGETTAGRARLYARSGDAAHAAELLRGAARRRCARLAGVGPAASALAVADAAAAVLGRPRAAIVDVLDGPPPRGDSELVDLADALRDLETALRAALATSHPSPGRTNE